MGPMTVTSRYATLAEVLRDDEAVLYRAWIAHKTVHQCDDGCKAQQALEEARDKIRELLGRES
jgi:cysteine sulfinate desulfinase/cysteine desulfurase-like protein